jgi:OHCU decarboxylase
VSTPKSAPPSATPTKRVHPVDEVLPLPKLHLRVGEIVGKRRWVVAAAGGGAITLDEVNSMTKERFTAVFGHVVHDIPWAVERAFEQRPYSDTQALREAFQDAVLTGSSEQQLELINTFHDLGAEDENNYRFDDLVADANPIAAARFSRLNELQ